MHIENLEYIIEIYNAKSISKASKHLFISQPRLSQVLRATEDEVGYEIFERTRTGIVATQKGEDFIRSACSVVQEYQKMRAVAEPLAEDSRLLITAVNSSLLSHAFFNHKRKAPPSFIVQDVYREIPSPLSVMQDVVNHQSRLGLFYVSNRQLKRHQMYAREHGLTTRVLAEKLSIGVVVPRRHSLTKKPDLHTNDVLNYPFVTYNDVDYDTILGALGFKRDTEIQYVSCRATYYEAIRIGGYISVSAPFAPGEEARSECVFLPTTEQDVFHIVLCVTNTGYQPTPREEAFLQYCSEYLAVAGR